MLIPDSLIRFVRIDDSFGLGRAKRTRYHLIVVTTRDGRTLSVAAEDAQQLTLRLIGQDTRIAKSEILSRETSAISMMPEGLLKALSDGDILDLIAYLRTTAQVPLP